jgi:glycosyltransferase involved in cell wall biosynthesis
MKVACFHNFLTQQRGAELAFKNMVLGLKNRGHDITVYTFDISEKFKAEFLAHNINFFSFDFNKTKAAVLKSRLLSFLKYLVQYLSVVKKIAGVINSKDYDVIFVSHWYSAILIPGLKKPVMYYSQEPPRHVYEYDPGGFGELHAVVSKKIQNCFEKLILDRILNFVTKYMDLWCGRCAEIIVGNSDYSKNILQKIYKKPVLRVYLGVDTDVFRKTKTEKQNIVLSVGPLRVFKGHDFVIEGLSCLPTDKRPNLIIVGAGELSDKNYLLELSKKLDVNIEIRSDINTEALVELYNSAIATICSFVREPFGLVAIESMACGTPVIAVEEGGLVETVNRERGTLVKRNTRELADAIALLVANTMLEEELGKNGIEFVRKNFTWGMCCENLEKALIDIAKEKL